MSGSSGSCCNGSTLAACGYILNRGNKWQLKEQYLVNRSSEDAARLLSQLEQAKTTAHRIVQRMEAMGVAALEGHEWPEGYTQADFVQCYQVLDALPGLVVADAVRDVLFKLVSSVV